MWLVTTLLLFLVSTSFAAEDDLALGSEEEGEEEPAVTTKELAEDLANIIQSGFLDHEFRMREDIEVACIASHDSTQTQQNCAQCFESVIAKTLLPPEEDDGEEDDSFEDPNATFDKCVVSQAGLPKQFQPCSTITKNFGNEDSGDMLDGSGIAAMLRKFNCLKTTGISKILGKCTLLSGTGLESADIEATQSIQDCLEQTLGGICVGCSMSNMMRRSSLEEGLEGMKAFVEETGLSGEELDSLIPALRKEMGKAFGSNLGFRDKRETMMAQLTADPALAQQILGTDKTTWTEMVRQMTADQTMVIPASEATRVLVEMDQIAQTKDQKAAVEIFASSVYASSDAKNDTVDLNEVIAKVAVFKGNETVQDLYDMLSYIMNPMNSPYDLLDEEATDEEWNGVELTSLTLNRSVSVDCDPIFCIDPKKISDFLEEMLNVHHYTPPEIKVAVENVTGNNSYNCMLKCLEAGGFSSTKYLIPVTKTTTKAPIGVSFCERVSFCSFCGRMNEERILQTCQLGQGLPDIVFS